MRRVETGEEPFCEGVTKPVAAGKRQGLQRRRIERIHEGGNDVRIADKVVLQKDIQERCCGREDSTLHPPNISP